MIQYTTPTVTMRIRNVALDPSDDVWLTMQPYDRSTKGAKGDPMTIENPTVEVDGDDTVVTVRLTQEQSAALPAGGVQVQVNWLTGSGERGATTRANITVAENLLPEVKTR